MTNTPKKKKKKKSYVERAVEFYQICYGDSNAQFDFTLFRNEIIALKKGETVLPENGETIDYQATVFQNQVGLACFMSRSNASHVARKTLADGTKEYSGIAVPADTELGQHRHFLFIRPDIVGIESNHFGCSNGQFLHLLETCRPRAGKLVLKTFAKSPLEMLKMMNEIRKLTLTFRPSTLKYLSMFDDDFQESTKNQFENVNADTLKLELSSRKKKTHGTDTFGKSLLEKLLKRDDAKKVYEELKVKIYSPKGENHRRILTDLFSDTLAVEKHFDFHTGSTQVNSADAYVKILEAYNERRTDLGVADVISILDE